MSKTKYITSSGLAFGEEKDMEKLRRYSKKGWHLRSFALMGYTLEKGERTDYIYSVDYQDLQEEEKEEYFDFFSSTGWSHVISEGNIHIFRALAGTPPIYTDAETTVEKYRNSNRSLKKLVLPHGLLTLIFWICAWFSTGTLHSILLNIALILTALVLPLGMTILAISQNKWKAEERSGLTSFVKWSPVVLIFMGSILLILYLGVDRTIRTFSKIVLSGVLAGIALPTAIWLVMSLYHRVKN